MHDIKFIRDNPVEFDDLLRKRGEEGVSDVVLQLDLARRNTLAEMQELQHEKKLLSKSFGTLASQGQNIQELKDTINQITKKIDSFEQELNIIENKLQRTLEVIPNMLDEDVPYGDSEEDNLEVKRHGQPRTIPHPRTHFELGEALGMMDFTQTALMSGSRFVTLVSDLARLERALINFMIDIHTHEFGFIELSPPYLVRDEAMYGSGQLPKFSGDSFATTDGFRLIPTAEVSLVNFVSDMILPKESLEKRFVAHTPCFRSEAGSAGKDTRGMIRMHQFHKVELVSITTPEQSNTEHDYIVNAAETILQRLDLPYRIVLLCSKDTGFGAKKTYDLEVWLPSQEKYREISSCSNCGDFQARRMNTRYKDDGENRFVHTLNGSGVAVGRAMVAILENYQNADGSITVPKALVDYMGGITTIG